VLHTARGQLVTDREAGLAPADDDDVGRLGQKAVTPIGVPSPVGPSQPAVPWQSASPQLPLLPDVTSYSDPDGALYEYAAPDWPFEVVAVLPASAYTEAISGDATLVPPKTSHPNV
jgi:hypothetical protein